MIMLMVKSVLTFVSSTKDITLLSHLELDSGFSAEVESKAMATFKVMSAGHAIVTKRVGKKGRV